MPIVQCSLYRPPLVLQVSLTDNVVLGPVPDFDCYMPDRLGEKKFIDLFKWYLGEVRRTTEDPAAANAKVTRLMEQYRKLARLEAEPEESSEEKYTGPWVFKQQMYDYCKADVDILRLGCIKFEENCMNMYTPTAPKAGTIDGVRYEVGEPLPVPSPFSFPTAAGYCYDTFLRYFYEDGCLAQFSRDWEKYMRRAFSGGRTEALVLYLRVPRPIPGLPASQQHRIIKVDVISQYPFINCWGLYTAGAPEQIDHMLDWRQKCLPPNELLDVAWTMEDVVHLYMLATDESKGLDQIGNPCFKYGLSIVELTFQAPPDMHWPVLGCKDAVTGKLVFDTREHVDAVVNCLELWEAVQRGYTIKDVKKIMWWGEDKVRVGIFKPYMDTYFAAKVEAGGWPSHCRGDGKEEERARHMDELREKNPGIRLDEGRMRDTKDAAAYAAAKLMINSPWGKANQKQNQLKTAYFRETEYEKYYALITDPTMVCKFDNGVVNGTCMVSYRGAADNYEMTKDTNITVGIWTCAQGRLITFRHGVKLHKSQLMYLDTDGFYYEYNPNSPEHVLLPTAKDKLGALADENEEMEKKGFICREFLSAGPKNYAAKYESIDGVGKAKTEVKVKGHNLFAGYADVKSAQNTLTYRAMRRLIFKHAIQDEELRHLALVEAENEPGEEGGVEEELKEHLKILYPDRFVLGKNLSVTHKDHTITYGWSFDKRYIDQGDVTTTRIPTRPHS